RAGGRSRAAARARIVEHAGGPDRAGLPDQCGPGKADHRGHVSECVRAGDVRRGSPFPRRAGVGSNALMPRRALLFAGMAAFAVVTMVVLVWAIRSTPRLRQSTRAVAAPSPTAPAPPGRKIKARLFYVSESGTKLTGIERDVAYAENAAEQAREIVAAQV